MVSWPTSLPTTINNGDTGHNTDSEDVHKAVGELVVNRGARPTVYLDLTNGSDSNTGFGGMFNAKLTLSAAITAAGAGGLILAMGTENITTTQQVSITTSGLTIASIDHAYAKWDQSRAFRIRLNADVGEPTNILASNMRYVGVEFDGNRDGVANTNGDQSAVRIGNTGATDYEHIGFYNCYIHSWYDHGIRTASSTSASRSRWLTFDSCYFYDIGNASTASQRSMIHTYRSTHGRVFNSVFFGSGDVLDEAGGAAIDADQEAVGFNTADTWAGITGNNRTTNGMWIGPLCQDWEVDRSTFRHVDRIGCEFWSDRNTGGGNETQANRHVVRGSYAEYCGWMGFSLHGNDNGGAYNSKTFRIGTHPNVTNAVGFEFPQADLARVMGCKVDEHGYGNGTTRVAGDGFQFSSSANATDYGSFINATDNEVRVVYDGHGMLVQDGADAVGGRLTNNMIKDAAKCGIIVNSAHNIAVEHNDIYTGGGIVDPLAFTNQAAVRVQGATAPTGTILRANRVFDTDQEYDANDYFTVGAGVTTLVSEDNYYQRTAGTWTAQNP